jgi:hypothetical protein
MCRLWVAYNVLQDMRLLKVLYPAFLLLTFGLPEARSEGEPKLAIESASPEQFTLLLKKIKSLHSKGEATYTSGEISEDWLLFKPFLIVVRHDQVEFFLNSDLAAPLVLEFTRGTGVWSPNNTRWTARLKRPGEAESTELWSRADPVDDEELETIRKYREYRNSLKKEAEQAATSNGDKPPN